MTIIYIIAGGLFLVVMLIFVGYQYLAYKILDSKLEPLTQEQKDKCELAIENGKAAPLTCKLHLKHGKCSHYPCKRLDE